MKTVPYSILIIIAVLLSSLNVRAGGANYPARIGVYDSRALAYAHFSTPSHMQELTKQVQAAQTARAAGQTNRFQQLAGALRQQQDEIHREIFSTAPAAAAMAALKNRIPAMEKEAGVTAFISKWDEATLQKYSTAAQVDVTDRLVQEFHPNEKQLKVIAGLIKNKPLPLDQCNELIREGKI